MSELSKKALELIAYCKASSRVCPHTWNELYEMLPNKTRNDKGGWEPPLPLILGAWHETPAIQKIMRLREHIAWADKQGVIEDINDYLRSLPENDWHHIGE